MKLIRNINGVGKYAVVRLYRCPQLSHGQQVAADSALRTLQQLGVLELGVPGSPGEFFVIMLKDRSAPAALLAYAGDASSYDLEYASEVNDLAKRAFAHPLKKVPD